MPVRKIPKNYNYVTGGFASHKRPRLTGYESPLEHEYMLILEFEAEVETFEEQPVRIWFKGETGRKKSYVPDLLVKYRNGRMSELVEVKTTWDLKKNEQLYALKFKIAKAYAKEHGWKFRIVTEKEIRGAYLQNLKFLREYREVEPDPEIKCAAIAAVSALARGMTVGTLLEHVASSDDQKLIALPVIWHLVVLGHFKANLTKELSYQTRLTLPGEKS